MWGAPAPSPESGPLLGAAPARQVWAGSWAPSRGGAWASHRLTPTGLLPSSSHVFSSVPRPRASTSPRFVPAKTRARPRTAEAGAPPACGPGLPQSSDLLRPQSPWSRSVGFATCSSHGAPHLLPGVPQTAVARRCPCLHPAPGTPSLQSRLGGFPWVCVSPMQSLAWYAQGTWAPEPGDGGQAVRPSRSPCSGHPAHRCWAQGLCSDPPPVTPATHTRPSSLCAPSAFPDHPAPTTRRPPAGGVAGQSSRSPRLTWGAKPLWSRGPAPGVGSRPPALFVPHTRRALATSRTWGPDTNTASGCRETPVGRPWKMRRAKGGCQRSHGAVSP